MRNIGLDLVRIIAVVLVLGRHLHLPDDANLLLRLWYQGGWVGVDIFFVLSGFLVSSLMFREHLKYGAVNVKRFLIRRAFKIYPAFWCFLAVTVSVQYALDTPPTRGHLLAELLFLQNYRGGVWNHTWSLAVEEHFYLGIAALFSFWKWLKPNHSYSGIPFVFFVIGFVCFSLRLVTLYFHPDFSYFAYLFGTHIRIDSLFFGVLLSYCCVYRQLERKLSFVPTWLFFFSGSLFLAPAFIFPLETNKWISTVGVILFYVGSGCIVIAALRFPESHFLPFKILGALGAASYSIYLWHMPVNVWGWRLVKRLSGIDSFVLYCVVYIIGSCLFGLAMSRVVEFPALRLRNYLYPSDNRSDSNNREKT